MPISALPNTIRDKFEIHEWRHASAILATDFPNEWNDLCDVLPRFRLCKSYITKGGGNKSEISKWFHQNLNVAKGWIEKEFDTSVVVDGQKTDSPTHSVDCFKNRVALELEWNNKDPFYDRDLNNFRLLFELRVVSVGIIVTRCDALQDIFDSLGRGTSYGQSTTHMRKLLPKIEGGGAGGCPVLVFGIKETLYDEHC
jgi:Restriction endonuclease BglII